MAWSVAAGGRTVGSMAARNAAVLEQIEASIKADRCDRVSCPAVSWCPLFSACVRVCGVCGACVHATRAVKMVVIQHTLAATPGLPCCVCRERVNAC